MNNNKGFSLIEIVIFGFIAITLLTLFIGLAVNSKEFARTLGCVNNMKNIAQAIENYQADYRTTPVNLADLHPRYITNSKTFKCPADKTDETNSYEKFYIGRYIAEDDPNKIFLACPRHNRNTKTVAAYLSYAVDIGKNMPVKWSGTPAEFGEVYTGGELTFADGTTVNINSGHIGLVSSFQDNEEKIYSIIYNPEVTEGDIGVTHNGDSKFEVITPAVIAGVAGTQFTIKTAMDNEEYTTTVNVTDGEVYVEDRGQDIEARAIQANTPFSISTAISEEILTADSTTREEFLRRVPRKHGRKRR
jgi:competence protein ComGC